MESNTVVGLKESKSQLSSFIIHVPHYYLWSCTDRHPVTHIYMHNVHNELTAVMAAGSQFLKVKTQYCI